MTQLVNSVYAASPIRVSEKYSFVPTTRVIDLLADRGWEPISSSEARTRNLEIRGHQKHMVRLRRPGQDVIPGELVPEVLVINSHMGSASFKFMVGLFRLICSNGLVVSDGMFGTLSVRRVGFDTKQVFSAIDEIMAGIPRVTERVQTFRDIELTPDEQGVFSAAAASLRWEDTSRIDTMALVQAQRFADRAPTLWNTYNRVQERMIGGGRVIRPGGWRGRGRLHRNKAVAVTGIDQNVRLNKALWQLTEEMAKIKGATL